MLKHSPAHPLDRRFVFHQENGFALVRGDLRDGFHQYFAGFAFMKRQINPEGRSLSGFGGDIDEAIVLVDDTVDRG
jgi:hypothetical protein